MRVEALCGAPCQAPDVQPVLVRQLLTATALLRQLPAVTALFDTALLRQLLAAAPVLCQLLGATSLFDS